jgi:hypothetical protein
MTGEEKNKKTKLIVAIGISVIFVVSLFGFMLSGKQDTTSIGDQFTTCLVASGAKMYGAWWCTHCNSQKIAFGDSWKIMADGGGYVECANEDKSQNQFCKDANITGYPTWRFAKGHELQGLLKLETLSIESGCK